MPEEAISLVREALLRGASDAEVERLSRGLDPDLVATERWLQTTSRGSRPRLDPVFARDLRRTLVQAAASAEDATAPLYPPSEVWRDSRREASTRLLPKSEEPPAPAAAARRWPWRQFATAAVLVLLLIGSVLLVRQVTFERPQTQLSAVGEPTTETLADMTLTNTADSWTPLTVERWRFLAGDATLTIPPLDGPQWIVADTGSIVATVAGDGQTLAPARAWPFRPDRNWWCAMLV